VPHTPNGEFTLLGLAFNPTKCEAQEDTQTQEKSAMLSSYETRHAHLPQAIVPLPIERHVGPGHDERVDRQPYHGDLAVPSWRGPQASAERAASSALPSVRPSSTKRSDYHLLAWFASAAWAAWIVLTILCFAHPELFF
jgi:hypothetical protein